MAPRADDEQPDPPSGEVPEARDGAAAGPLPSPQEQWDDIVAQLADLDVPGDPVSPHVVRAARPDEPEDHTSGRDWDGTSAMDAATEEVDALEHFVPPDPGPVLGGDPLTTMGWLAVVVMPVLWLVVLLGWRSAPSAVLQASGVVFVLGVGVLVWRMPHRRDPGSGDDDGAVV